MVPLKCRYRFSVSMRESGTRCRANLGEARQSRPDSGLGFQVQVLEAFQVVLSSLGRDGTRDSSESALKMRFFTAGLIRDSVCSEGAIQVLDYSPA